LLKFKKLNKISRLESNKKTLVFHLKDENLFEMEFAERDLVMIDERMPGYIVCKAEGIDGLVH
jgi:hypothetical protein